MRKRLRRNSIMIFLLGWTLFSSISISPAQEKVNLGDYPVFVDSLNVIENNEALLGFYSKLKQLEQGENKVVSILQIGDSHIQADFVSMYIRNQLQLQFGNAGRGLIFPLKLAKTNEPLDFRIKSNVEWQNKKIKDRKDPMKKGLAGAYITTREDSFYLDLDVINKTLIDYCFRKATMVYEKGKNAHGFDIADTSGRFVGFFDPLVGDDQISVFESDTETMALRFIACSDDTLATTTFYGFILENGESGILYHSVGINGAEYYDYLLAPGVLKQQALLKPDLIIVSLGTNDAYRKTFDEEEFCGRFDRMLTVVRETFPDVPVLLSTPGDYYRRRKYKNPATRELSWLVAEYAKEKSYPYWDFYNIMGGYGSINKWFRYGLIQKDKLHCTRRGYEVQGELFFNALMNGYRNAEELF
ncbi:MAG: hypothetical protein KKA07_02845 [Bacteroidetes bacterium]|nr:hypothetical protein [Bacteroidota bacterium]MBU1717988.1 hypothetical protein [Bacteroidota bacterium]